MSKRECPFGGTGSPMRGLARRSSSAKAARRNDPLYYGTYLQLDKLLSCVQPESEKAGCAAHDEHLFIVIHQTYELWFKQCLHELGSMRKIFNAGYVREEAIATAVSRLHRVTEILRILVEQLTVLETMSPLGFLDFRDFLFPASGFQSVQFRKIENMLGLSIKKRIKYSGRGYCTYLSPEHAAEVKATEEEPSILQLIGRWLERIPFLAHTEEDGEAASSGDGSEASPTSKTCGGFDFWGQYRKAVLDMFQRDRDTIRARGGGENGECQEAQLAEIDKSEEHYLTIFDREKRVKSETCPPCESIAFVPVTSGAHGSMCRYDALRAAGKRQLSYRAMQAALLITVYQDEPVLQLPFRLIEGLLNIDELLTTWRYRHALMVHRMLGVKIGTGGSSGYMYLRATASSHKIFDDLFNLSSFLLPRHSLPRIPIELKRKLAFAVEGQHQEGSDAETS